MKKQLFTIFTRTPLHVGAGNSVGAIDSPIMRERHTRIPIIPGSSLKGVLRDLFNDSENQESIFGKNEEAGKLLVGEARVLAFPVRSAKGSFAWITCPLALARYQRDAEIKLTLPENIKDMACCASEKLQLDGKVILEEYCFNSQKLDETIAAELKKLSVDTVWQEIAERLVVLSDEMFSYFVENACEVVTRTKINDKTGVVDNSALFNLEQVPSETMFYAVFGENNDGCLSALESKLTDCENLIQLGGDATTGLGFCTVKLI
ncbi:MAG: type III-B CRISPR module RAMP protein Cmr4 [Victivallaceae bacterium]|nr:type III-B CRISPR module RAMP protein Cmr4 [Victivallaceae bacterium]